MAKRKKRGGRRKAKPSALALAGVGLAGYNVYSKAKAKPGEEPETALLAFTGVRTGARYDGSKRFDLPQALDFWAPALAGVIGARVAAKTGINRYLPKWLPFKL